MDGRPRDSDFRTGRKRKIHSGAQRMAAPPRAEGPDGEGPRGRGARGARGSRGPGLGLTRFRRSRPECVVNVSRTDERRGAGLWVRGAPSRHPRSPRPFAAPHARGPGSSPCCAPAARPVCRRPFPRALSGPRPQPRSPAPTSFWVLPPSGPR